MEGTGRPVARIFSGVPPSRDVSKHKKGRSRRRDLLIMSICMDDMYGCVDVTLGWFGSSGGSRDPPGPPYGPVINADRESCM